MSQPTPAQFHKDDLKNCERISAKYLESLGFCFVQRQRRFIEGLSTGVSEDGDLVVYHEQHGQKNPDFTLYRNGSRIGVIEHEDLNLTKEDWAEIEDVQHRWRKGLPLKGYVKTCDPYEPIREKIKEASRQFRDVEGLPCHLIIHDYSARRNTGEWAVLGAMMGDVSIQVPISMNGDRPDVRAEPRNVFGADGRMVNHPFVEQNNVISAVSILDRSYLSRWHEGREDDHPRLTVYLNPFAKVAWPDGLWGPRDTVYKLNWLTKSFERVNEPPPPPLPKDVRSQAQKDIDALLNDPMLRCD